MNIANLTAGTYVVAVSGGVDSMVLLDMLASQPGLTLVVAHFDHGIRDDSAADAVFVARVAKRYGFVFESERQELGSDASEATARRARYGFLERVRIKYGAAAIVTAHHQDDLLETAIINLQRGTGWRGLCSLRDLPARRRPLLGTSKAEIVAYATSHNVRWREDHTNADIRYVRNRIRRHILPRFSQSQRRELLALIARQVELRAEVEVCIDRLLKDVIIDGDRVSGMPNDIILSRNKLILLPNPVAKELLLAVVYKLTHRRLEAQTVTRMLWFAKTAHLYKTLQVNAHIDLFAERTTVVVRSK